jgi:hypothetical protein
LASKVLEAKGGEANQDVRGRPDCQAERLATIDLVFSGFPRIRFVNIKVRLVHFT